MANDSIYGLMAYVFGEESDAMRVARRLESGMVAVNRGVVSDPAAPFGGVKQSGLGREGSSEGILEFLEGLFGEAQHPAGHRDGNPVSGQFKDQRVHHFGLTSRER